MKTQLLLVVLHLSQLYGQQSPSHKDQPSEFELKKRFYWGFPEFKFPNSSAKKLALSTGSYIPQNNAITAMGVWKDKVFISIFRFKFGVASSLNYFPINSTTKSPVLIPYPSFDVNYVRETPLQQTFVLPSNSSIICGGYIRIDRCDRLWILDAGYNNFLGPSVRLLTPPALVIFDLKTNTLLRRYTIPAEFVNSHSNFGNLDLDFSGNNCNDVYAYIVDMFRSIVVYSFKNNRSWRLVHNLFGSEPQSGIFHYEGVNIQWNFGVLALTVGEQNRDGSRRVYINPFSSTKSYYISNKILQNEAYIAVNDYYYDVHLLGDRGKKGQLYKWAYDEKTNILFDVQFNRWRVDCWNTVNPYRNCSFAVVYQSDRSFFPADIIIDRNRNLWVLDTKLPRFVFGVWKANAKNTQIFMGKVDDVTSGTVCRHKIPDNKWKHHNTK